MQTVGMRVAGAGRGMWGWWQRVCRVKTSGGEIGKWGLGEFAPCMSCEAPFGDSFKVLSRSAALQGFSKPG